MQIKRWFVFIGVLLISCNNKISQSSSLIDQVPSNTAILLKINDFDSFKSQLTNNDLINKVSKTEIYASIRKKTEVLKNIEVSNQSLLGFTATDKLSDFYLITHHDSVKLNPKNTPSQKIDHPKGSYLKYDIGETSFLKLNLDNQTIVCSSKTLAENFLNKTNLQTASPELRKLYEASSNSKPASILLNMGETQKILAPLLQNDSTINMSNLLDWAMLDMELPQKKLNFNGIGLANDSLPKIANLFRNTNAVTNNIQNYAPKTADAILSYTFNDFAVFKENRLEYFGLKSTMDSIFNTVEEIGLIWNNNKKSAILQTYGADNLAEFLNNHKKSALEYQGAQIITLDKNTILNESFKPLLSNFATNFYTVLENAFIFSEEKEQLQQIISNYKNGTTLQTSNLYLNAKDALAAESSILFLSKANGITPFVQQYFSPQTAKDYKTAKLNANFYTFQLVSDDGFFHANASIKQNTAKEKSRSVSKLFTVQLENDLATNPQFVTNHRTKKKEIVVQDINDQLYLISTDGKVLWKKQLKGKIQGEISQIDIYKNGRLQLAFTTENQFIVLDRNGKEVKPFVMDFKEGGLNQLAVFDYEKKKDYRFVITQGKNVYMYNNKGRIVDGFTYKKASGNVLSAPQHITLSKKDYLVFKQEDGLKIVSRTGKERVKGFPKINPSDNKVQLYKNNFTITDKKGTLFQIDQKAKTTQTKLNLNKYHGFDATNKTLVYMDNNTLTIKGRKVELDLGVYSKPRIFYINDKIFVSVTDIQNQKIYLFDSLAKPIPNFPVYGSSIIELSDMDNDKKLELVAKDLDNSIVVYGIN